MSYTIHNINSKPYAYGCSIQIYWTTSANEYWNIFTKKKHICPNRRQKSATALATATATAGITPPSTTSKPHYYNLTYYCCKKNTIYFCCRSTTTKTKIV